MSRRYDGDWVGGRLLADRAERLGDRPAVSTPDSALSYAELADAAARVATGLRAIGVGPGDRVATMLPGTVGYLRAWWGIVWAGAVDVPANNDLKGALLQRLLVDSGARVLVIDATWLPRLAGLALPDLEHVVVSGTGTVPLPGVAVHDLGALAALDPGPLQPRTESDLLYVMYTSGTTGPSKGVMHSNRSALWNAAGWIDVLELTDADVAYSMFPLFHVTARSAVVTSAFWAGGQVHLGPAFSPARFWDDVRAAGATCFCYMGIVVHLLHAQPPRPDDADNPVRRAFGAAAPPAILEAFEARFGLELVEVYGSTELGVATAPGLGKRRKLGTMGKPLDHLLVEVHDADGNTLGPEEQGEIVARPNVPQGMSMGYWQDPRGTLDAFRNLWFHSGDGGYFDDEGWLVFTDRVKDSLRRRGENISSFEVERLVQDHPDVLECAAYGVPAELTEDEVMVALVPRPGHAIDPEDVMRHCVAEMPRFMVPRFVRVMDALPKTPSQRIEKYRLRAAGVTPDAFDREAAGIVVPRS